MESTKSGTNGLIYITENTVTDVKNTLMVTGGKAGGEINWDMA